uniref:Uncharacterized protein n=1 Tax=Rhizochromulina marina TaxID=1034831 RepID=A0A7S2RB82_9STRA|mmetsp:Transcript_13756/g.40199  ORF Transcript_13756/g.40199 Transcript_13756/m.40199 type:complete len:103 (+) Transcript_13756:140-448(+)
MAAPELLPARTMTASTGSPSLPLIVEGVYQVEFEYSWFQPPVEVGRPREADALEAKMPARVMPKAPKRSVTPATRERRLRCQRCESSIKPEVIGGGQCEFES